jgi:phytanoyl-CoA hydroxylase
MGDVQWNGGGLIYLQGSAQIGKEIERKFNAAAAHLSEAERISAYNETMMDTGYLEPDSGKFSRIWGKKWLVADYEAGDLVLHSPYMIHSSARNDNKEGVIRLATDLRFVEEGKPYDTRWMNIYQPGDEVER